MLVGMSARELEDSIVTLTATTSLYNDVFSQSPVSESARKKITVLRKRHTQNVENLRIRHATYVHGLGVAEAGEDCVTRRFCNFHMIVCCR